MVKKLKPSVRSYIHDDNIYKRYLRPAEASKIFGLDESRIIQFASAAGAIYQLPRILLIRHHRLEDYMKYLYKVPGANKLVHKKYVQRVLLFTVLVIIALLKWQELQEQYIKLTKGLVEGEDGNWSHVVKSYEFSKEDIEQVKQYVKDNGMGNSESRTVLSSFINWIVVE